MNQYHDDDPLRVMKPHHWAALQVLLDGGTQEAAAEAAGVSRETVNRWLNGTMPAFAAELNRARRHHREALADRFTRTLAAAMDVVDDALKGGDARIALAVMKLNARAFAPLPDGPESADEIIQAAVDARVRQVDLDLQQMREAQQRDRVAEPSPDRHGIQVTIENEMRAGLGEPPHSADTPYDSPHWSESEVIPCSRIIAAETDNEALTLALSSFDSATESDHVIDVSPLTPLCVSLLAEIIDPERGLLRDCEPVDTGDDPFDLERLDPHFQSALTSLNQQTLAAAVDEWSDSHDRAIDLGWDESHILADSLRRIAKAAEGGRRLYLATADCPYADVPDDPPTRPIDDQPTAGDEPEGHHTGPETPPAEHGETTAA